MYCEDSSREAYIPARDMGDVYCGAYSNATSIIYLNPFLPADFDRGTSVVAVEALLRLSPDSGLSNSPKLLLYCKTYKRCVWIQKCFDFRRSFENNNISEICLFLEL